LQTNLGARSDAEHTLAAGLEAAGQDPTLAVERAWLLLEHSRTSRDLGAESREELLQAVTLLRTKLPESHPAILRVLNELCGLEMAMPDDAPDCAQTAARLEHDPDTAPELRAAIYVNQSHLAAARADDAAARSLAVRAVAAAETFGTPESLWRAYFQLATVMRSRNEMLLAVFFGKETVAQIERERSHFVGEDRRHGIHHRRMKPDVLEHLKVERQEAATFVFAEFDKEMLALHLELSAGDNGIHRGPRTGIGLIWGKEPRLMPQPMRR